MVKMPGITGCFACCRNNSRHWGDGSKKTSYIKGTIAACNLPARFWHEKKHFNS